MTVGTATLSSHPVLDAAEACFARRGVRRTTVEDIAVEAGVARITVYRQIGGRDELIRLVMLRIIDRLVDRLRPRLLAADDLGEALVELVMASMRAARRDDLALFYASDEGNAVGEPLPGLAALLFERYGLLVAEMAGALPGRLPAGVSPDEAGEWVLRVIISLLTVEPAVARTPRQTADLVRRLVIPALAAPH